MIGTTALRRSAAVAALSAILALALCASPARSQETAPTDEEIFKLKCTLCHTGHRVYRITPEEVRPVLERMRKMNPDWITTIESEHIAKHIATILADPSAMATRTAWDEAVGRGGTLFNDPTLGSTGKSCAGCHPQGSLRNVEDAYPKFNAKLKRFVDLQEAINLMIQEKMKGQPLPPNDQRYFDLLAYIKSLK